MDDQGTNRASGRLLIEKRQHSGRQILCSVGIVLALVAISLALEFGLSIQHAWVIVIFGMFILVGLVHELEWMSKKPGQLVEGVIIGLVEDDSSDGGVAYHPRIEYILDQTPHTFVSSYAHWPLHVGTVVKVWVPKNGKPPEWYGLSQRVLFTVVPIVFGVVGLLAFFDVF